MSSIAHFRARFTPSWTMIILATIGIFLLCKLGLWQLSRANEKRVMIAQFERLKGSAATELSQLVKPRQYQAVKVSGQYLNESQFLLDNQHFKHQFGFNVLSPMVLSNGSVVLVDRGWIKADVSRKIKPSIKSIQGIQKITGKVYFPSIKGLVLGEVIEPNQSWPKIIEKIDLPLLAKALHKTVLPFIIRLDKNQSNGFVREWKLVSMPAERHIAYAIQWFALAFLVFVLFIVLNWERVGEK